MEEIPLPVSQSSSLLAFEPVLASVASDNERRRRLGNQKLGACRTGCDDIDDYVLMGGLERGSVVGMSSEREDEFGLKLAVQILAHSFCQGVIKRVLVITPKPATTILPVLRDGITAEWAAKETGWKSASSSHKSTKVREILDKVMLSCIFDMDGLVEVLADLDRPVPSPSPVEQVEEIQDSEDDDEDELEEETANTSSSAPAAEKVAPDMIIITHFSSLLSALFSHRTSTAAHAKLQFLSSHMRHLSRSLPSNPLILILNSTNTAVDNTVTAATTGTAASAPHPPPQSTPYPSERQRKPLDPTLRSIFYNPQPSPNYGEPASNPATRRYTVTKPAFGLVFAQLLDLHLLCTRVPRSKKDAELLAGVHPATAPTMGKRDREAVEFVTVVEVLLDEMRVWKTVTDGGIDGDGNKRWLRKNREQRWGPVVIENGRVIEAFPQGEGAPAKTENLQPVRVHGGFGGPRV